MTEELKTDGRNIRSRSEWSERIEHVEESWEHSRPVLFKHVVMSAALPPLLECFYCGIKQGVVRCRQCGPAFLICSSCDIDIHTSHVLHDREIWNGSYFKAVPPNDFYDESTNEIYSSERSVPLTLPKVCSACEAIGKMERFKKGERKRIIVTLRGRYDLMDAAIVCHNCNTAFTDDFGMIHEGYWPGSTTGRSPYIFDQDLFRFFSMLRLHSPGVSYGAFIKTLEQMSAERGRQPTINPVVFAKAYSEWRYCQFEIKKLRKQPLFECPACYKEQHSIHIDGNRKLYRYSKVPRGVRTSYYEGEFVCRNEDVDNHLTVIGYDDESSSHTDQMCGSTRWKAAKAKSKTMSNLDETGLSVAGCRHTVAQKAINMFRGEIHGYAHYLHTKVFVPLKVKYLWEDVVCKYWPWAISKQHLFEMGTMKACLPVMHAKAHSWHCQVLWGGRWQDGAAGGSGEDMEQLFSYMSRWGFVTKYMSAGSREDTITEAVVFWNSQKIDKMPLQLRNRLFKARALVMKLTEELQEVQNIFSVELTPTVLSEYKSNICRIAQDELSSDSSLDSLSTEAKYYLLFKQMETSTNLRRYVDSTDMLASIAIESTDLYKKARALVTSAAEKQHQLSVMEQQLNFTSEDERGAVLAHGRLEVLKISKQNLENKMEMLYLIIMKRQEGLQKESTTSKQRTSLRRAVASDKKKIMECITQYNTILTELHPSDDYLSIEEVMDGKFPWSAITGTRHCISVKLQSEAVDIYMKLCRYKEEEQQLLCEMMSFLAYLKEVVLAGLSLSLTETVELSTRHGLDDVSQDQTLVSVSTRYATNTTAPLYVQGKIALLKESIARFKDILYNTLQIFQTIPEVQMDSNEYLNELEVNNEHINNHSILQDSCTSESEYDSEFSDYEM